MCALYYVETICSVCNEDVIPADNVFCCDGHSICDECLDDYINIFINDADWDLRIKCYVCGSHIHPLLLNMVEELYGLPTF